MVAASHSQQNPGVMPKSVGQPINRAWWQANSKITASDVRIIQYARDFIQTPMRNFGIDMHEPEHFATRSTSTHVHLHGPIGFASDELIAKAHTEISCVIGASAVGDNNLRFWRSDAQMLKKWAYEWRLIKDWHND
jgi:hypothetical protein